MEEKNIDIQTRLIGMVEAPKLDLTPYIGKKSKIASVKAIEGEYNGKKTAYLKVESESLDILKLKDGSGLDLKASKLLSLIFVENGNVAWTDKSNTAAYLKKMNVKTPLELVGKAIVIQTVFNKNKEQDFLSF